MKGYERYEKCSTLFSTITMVICESPMWGFTSVGMAIKKDNEGINYE